MGYTEQQIESVFSTSKATWRYSGIRNGAERTFTMHIIDNLTKAELHKIEKQPSIETGKQEVAAWLVKHKGGLTNVLTDDQARDATVDQLKSDLAATNARLEAVVAASLPPVETEAKKHKPGKRSAEPDPVRTSDE